MIINWNRWQTILQIPIVLVMFWATWETYKMRKTSQEQTAKNSMPLVIFDVGEQGYSYSIPILKNIGYGPALNIKISDLRNRKFKMYFDNVNGLEKDGQITLTYHIDDTILNMHLIIEDSDIFHSSGATIIPIEYYYREFNKFLNYMGEEISGETLGQSLGEITVKYEDLTGHKYSLKQALYYNGFKNRLYSKIIEFPKYE